MSVLGLSDENDECLAVLNCEAIRERVPMGIDHLEVSLEARRRGLPLVDSNRASDSEPGHGHH